MAFKLNETLAKDCIPLGRFELCRILLMNDRHYPWIILVPEIEGVTEIFELNKNQRQQLMDESAFVLEAMQQSFKADKMNQGAIGNMVSQLHIHHVARFKNDAAWPAPVWGAVKAMAYSEAEKSKMIDQVKDFLINHPTYQQ